MTLIKILFALFCASSIFAAVPPDGEATRLLIGEWVSAKLGQAISGTTTFNEDGTFTGSGRFTTSDGEIAIKVEGKWRVERGILIEEVTRSSHPKFIPVGFTTSDTLLSVTKKEFRFRTEQGIESANFRATKGKKEKPTE